MIRETTTDEAATIADLLRRGFCDVAERFELTAERCPSFPAHCTADWIREEAAQGTRFFVIEEQGRAGGCVGMRVEGAQCWMVRLAVAPEYRHRGFGRDLTVHVEREAWRLGFRRLDLAVVAENGRLCHWYHQLGYKDREIKRESHLPYTLVYMFKEAANHV